ncbi:WD40 repeat domain-containing serine/threonine protein kinase [Actinomadura rayongensis]|uniref:Protein kinase n=1 Tax=Actinomadura rayongensis TaxID=1429076 RepID=A0A6I4WGR5_9ACTN|nr:WD40 repeat domain-containing serine/threonine protein kinase [Actinomadura rayongensis]MXQ67016.1 protein kinase [Actinomadura rayongensis]
MTTPLLPGDPRQLGAYYLDGRLGSGGQGVVYEGYGPDNGRVAVKALHGVSDRDRNLLRKEVAAWRRVAPFCTAKVLHDGLDEAIPFVVSEYVAGPDLAHAVERNGRYGPEELRRLAIGVATALVAIHRAGVVHRDLKPENILIGPDGARVIDFGIARVEEPSPSTVGVLRGTLRYMPPERYRGQRGDAAVDVWSWGAVVLFAATGRHAFDGRTPSEIQRQVAEHRPDVSMLGEPLRGLVSRALAKESAERPTSEELLLALVGRADLAAALNDATFRDLSGSGPLSSGERAEAVFGGLGEGAREAVPRVLLRLVAPGERAEDTLRTARRADFADGQTAEADVDEVLRAFGAAGILVWEDGLVALANAALIRAWPRLREWVAAEREGLGVHHGLSGASRLWDDHGRKNSDLYQGTALARALSWAATGRRLLTLNRTERSFLDAAAALARGRARLRALLSGVLAVLLIAATGSAVIAIDQRATVVGQRDRALSAQVASLAESLRRTDPQLARRLAVASARLGNTSQSWGALLALHDQWEDESVKLPGFEATANDLAGSGRILAAATGSRVEFWDVDTRKHLGSYDAPERVTNVSLSDDGGTAAVSTRDGRTRLVGTANARPRDTRTYPSPRGDKRREELSPHGTYLMVQEDDPGRPVTLGIWDTRTGKKIVTVNSGRWPLGMTSFSYDERVLSLPVGSGRQPFTWLDTRTHKKIPVPDLQVSAADVLGPLTFSPDGRFIALPVRGGRIRVHDLAHRYTNGDLVGASDISFYPVQFSRDGRYLAQGTTVWDTDFSITAKPFVRYTTTDSECYADTIRASRRTARVSAASEPTASSGP